MDWTDQIDDDEENGQKDGQRNRSLLAPSSRLLPCFSLIKISNKESADDVHNDVQPRPVSFRQILYKRQTGNRLYLLTVNTDTHTHARFTFINRNAQDSHPSVMQWINRREPPIEWKQQEKEEEGKEEEKKGASTRFQTTIDTPIEEISVTDRSVGANGSGSYGRATRPRRHKIIASFGLYCQSLFLWLDVETLINHPSISIYIDSISKSSLSR